MEEQKLRISCWEHVECSVYAGSPQRIGEHRNTGLEMGDLRIIHIALTVEGYILPSEKGKPVLGEH